MFLPFFSPELLTSCMMRMTPHFSVCVCVNVLLLMSLIFIFVVVGRFSLSSLRVFLLVSFRLPIHESGMLFPFPSLQERKEAGRTYAHARAHTRTREEREIDPLLRKSTRIPSHLCAWRARRHEASMQVTGTLSFFVFPSQKKERTHASSLPSSSSLSPSSFPTLSSLCHARVHLRRFSRIACSVCLFLW